MKATENPGPDVVGLKIGTAGWSLPADVRHQFPPGDSLLTRYAQVFNAVEVNSSFYRPHQQKTYGRWAASTPAGFRFAVKAPRMITHERRLEGIEDPLNRFVGEIGGLEGKLGCVLIQLPPSLEFDLRVVEAFLGCWRERFDGGTALEPRHASWFTREVEALLVEYRIARVAADPAPVAAAGEPGGWKGFQYHRLHGSPEIYASSYTDEATDRLAAGLSATAWVIFDNTKFGAATKNALHLLTLTRPDGDPVPEPRHAR